MKNPLISIIMPVYNSERYVGDAIKSVILQSYKNWELLIVNDGSKDNSANVISSFKDPRIVYFEQENSGVSSARNVGLANMRGEYFCFLDSDDQFPFDSLEVKLRVFAQDLNIYFVDGSVENLSQDMAKVSSSWTPEFRGNPFEDLIKLTGASFFGITWMIKREEGRVYKFQDNLRHCEDLWFFIQLSQNGEKYDFTERVTYLRRVVDGSAMSDLEGLAEGYLALRALIVNIGTSARLIKEYSKKVKSILFRSYVRRGEFIKALLILTR